MGKTTKRVCVFNANLESKYPFIQKTTSESDVKCLKCHGRFSIAAGGNNDIVRHLKTAKHIAALNAGILFLFCEKPVNLSELFCTQLHPANLSPAILHQHWIVKKLPRKVFGHIM